MANEQETQTADVKFELRGFNTEAPEGEKEVTAEEADAIAAQMQAGAAPAAEEGVEEKAAAAPAEKPAPKVKIGDKEFATQEEAFEYAKELERQQLANDAFRQGIEAAQRTAQSNPQPATLATPTPEEFGAEFYADPAAYLRKRDEQIAARVKAEISQGLSQKERNEQTWREFYNDYPDLAKAKELVELTLSQNWETLKNAETKKALKIVAEKVREKRKEMLADLLPGEELKTGKAPTSPGNGKEVTLQKPDEKPLSFVNQFKNLRAKRAASLRK